MKLNFSTPILDLEAKPIVAKDKPVTLGSVVIEALMATFPDEANLPGADKVKRFSLGMAVTKGGEQDISVDDVVLLKTLIGKAYGPLVVGRVYELIEAADK